MNFQKANPHRIPHKSNAYRELQGDILDRDGYICQCCGGGTDEPPHHFRYLSDNGSDTRDNMVAICQRCHHIIHHGTIDDLIPLIIKLYGRKHFIRYFLMGVVLEKEQKEESGI